MINRKKISLVIPCRNEQEALKVVLKSLPKQIDEVIVIDNLSTDNTAKIARKFGAKVLSEQNHINGIGYGYALNSGINSSSGDIIICLDGDGSYPVKEIPKIVKFLENNKFHFISCNRLPIVQLSKMSFLRMFGVHILNILFWVLYGYKIQDSLTGMWVFKREILPILNLNQGGWNFSLEIKLNAVTSKDINFSEYHIPYQDRIFDQSKQNLFKTGFEHFLFLFTNKFSFRRNIHGHSALDTEPGI